MPKLRHPGRKGESGSASRDLTIAALNQTLFVRTEAGHGYFAERSLRSTTGMLRPCTRIEKTTTE